MIMATVKRLMLERTRALQMYPTPTYLPRLFRLGFLSGRAVDLGEKGTFAAKQPSCNSDFKMSMCDLGSQNYAISSRVNQMKRSTQKSFGFLIAICAGSGPQTGPKCEFSFIGSSVSTHAQAYTRIDAHSHRFLCCSIQMSPLALAIQMQKDKRTFMVWTRTTYHCCMTES